MIGSTRSRQSSIKLTGFPDGEELMQMGGTALA